jgi:hypothetical protein
MFCFFLVCLLSCYGRSRGLFRAVLALSGPLVYGTTTLDVVYNQSAQLMTRLGCSTLACMQGEVGWLTCSDVELMDKHVQGVTVSAIVQAQGALCSDTNPTWWQQVGESCSMEEPSDRCVKADSGWPAHSGCCTGSNRVWHSQRSSSHGGLNIRRVLRRQW